MTIEAIYKIDFENRMQPPRLFACPDRKRTGASEVAMQAASGMWVKPPALIAETHSPSIDPWNNAWPGSSDPGKCAHAAFINDLSQEIGNDNGRKRNDEQRALPGDARRSDLDQHGEALVAKGTEPRYPASARFEDQPDGRGLRLS